MARRNKNRLSKKEKRKCQRQTRKLNRKEKFMQNNKNVKCKKMSVALGEFSANNNNPGKCKQKKIKRNNNKLLKKQFNQNQKSIILNEQNRMDPTCINDDIASTSRCVMKRNIPSPKKKFSRSPIKKFQKFRDDQAKKLLKRSRQMIQGKNKTQLGINKTKYINYKNNSQKQSTKNHSQNYNKTTNITIDDDIDMNKDDGDGEDDDDCVIIEQTAPQVTILDDDDNDGDCDSESENESESESDDDDSTMHDDCKSNYSINNNNESIISTAENTSYQLISQSFAKRYSSTPSPERRTLSKPAISSNATASNVDVWRGQFFLDVARRTEYPENVIYNTIAPLTGNKVNENDATKCVIVLDDTITASNMKSKDNAGNTTKDSDTSSSSSDDSSEDDDDDEESKEEGEIPDDSVIFVSETNKNDFIPLPKANELNRHHKANKPKDSTEHYSNLLNRNEKLQLKEYNSNTYNPNAGKALTSKKRMVIIDGSNVAFKHSNDQVFSVKGLKIAIEYFEKLGHEVKAVIPQYRMNQHKSTDPNELSRLHKSGYIVVTPCKKLPGLTSVSYDDRFILQLASELDAAVVSNDYYRDLMHENAAFKKIIESRVIGYTWCNDMFLLPKDPYGKWGPTLDMILNRS